jgi:hypothetical protein
LPDCCNYNESPSEMSSRRPEFALRVTSRRNYHL